MFFHVPSLPDGRKGGRPAGVPVTAIRVTRKSQDQNGDAISKGVGVRLEDLIAATRPSRSTRIGRGSELVVGA